MSDVDRGDYTNPFNDGETRVYDIVNEYDWTTAPAGSQLRNETPNAYVTAYKMDFSQLQLFIDGFINIATNKNRAEKTGNTPGLQFYKDLYKSGKVLADMNFPFFSDNIRSFSNEYADTFSPISQRGSQFLFGEEINNLGNAAIGAVGGAAVLGREAANTSLMQGNAVGEAIAGGVQATGDAFTKLTGMKMPGLQTVGAPGSFIETPKFYQYSNTDEGVEIAFVLSNTLNDFRSNKGFKQNIKFIKEFTMMNRPFREGAIAMTFPAIYHIEIPGLRYIEWAYLENFGIELMGTRRRIGKDIIPEAYMVKFMFKSLTIEAANFVQMTNRTEGFDSGDSSYRQLRAQADADAVSRAQQEQSAAAARQQSLLSEISKANQQKNATAEANFGNKDDRKAFSLLDEDLRLGKITEQEAKQLAAVTAANADQFAGFPGAGGALAALKIRELARLRGIETNFSDVDNPRGVGGITRGNPFNSDASSSGGDGLGPGINIGPRARFSNFRRRQ